MPQFHTPILFLVFNRLETTKQVFERIRDIKPLFLFVAADGPRLNNVEDEQKCQSVREFILEGVDWNCQLKTLFRDENRGCGRGPSAAIDWFFEQVEEGIILEDDCLPTLGFFNYCEELLNKYESEEKIYHISGCNIQYGLKNTNDKYFFSQIPHMWGWATWKRAWNKYNFDALQNFSTDNLDDYWISVFGSVLKGTADIWDYQWVYTIKKGKGISITPTISLIENIGFDQAATHTTNAPGWYFFDQRSTKKLVKTPNVISINKRADQLTMQLLKGNLSFKNKVRIKLDKLFRI